MKDVELYNLTSPQKSIWLTEQFYKGTNINNICGIIPIMQSVDFEKLKMAINKFVENNDSYRIRLMANGNDVMQYVSLYSSFDIDVVDVHSDEELKSVAKNFSHHSFNMLDSQLFEFKLFRFPNGYGGFIFNTHHIISDSWTTGITINEIISMYYKLLQGENIDNIVKKDLSYINYINSEKEYIGSSKFQKDKEYWNELYKTIPEVATIPSVNIDNSKTASIDAHRIEFPIDSSLLSKMNKYCAENKVSIFNFLMSIYSIYIGRVSGIDDFCIGTPILNRTNFKEKYTSGMFINTLPVRIKLNEENSFKEFVSNIARNSMSLLRHQKYGYNYLLEDLRKKDSSLPSLYNIMISYQITKITDNMEEVPHENNWFFNNCIADDVEIHIFDFGDNGSLNIAYDYRLNKYSAKDMENIHTRVVHIIEQVLTGGDILLTNIDIVTPAEKKQLLYEFNNTKVDYPKDKTIVELFEEQVEKTPDNIAVVFEDKQLTYRELNEKANQLARYIIEKSIPKDSIIGILLPRSLDLLICIWAILKSSNGYILIDPALPDDRIKYMLDNSLSSLLITNDNNRNINFGNNLFINNISLSLFSPTNLDLQSNNDAFCIIYTSGSTGNPKGIELKRSSVINLLFAYKKFLYTDICDTFLSASTVAFDMFIVENFVSLLSGKKVILANEEEQKIPIFMSKLIEKHNVDFLLLTPSKIELLLLNDKTKECLRNLKIIQLGGEIFKPNLYERLSKYITNAKIFNGYGPAECTACCSNKQVFSSSNINIGKPFLNTQIYILNKYMSILPIGSIGEICIAGHGVAKGYTNNKDLTNKAFVKNPFGEGLLYRTGDLGRYLENGEIEYVGRRDSQVKLRGLRIELEEITNKITHIEGITNAISIIKKVNNIDCICSYVISNKNLNHEIIKNYLKNELPQYMVPSHIVFLDSLPITVNGKVNTKELPDIQLDQLEYVSPTTNTQIALSVIWSKLLNIDNISINYNFFELGGDSLYAIKLISEIYSTFNITVTIKDIFNYNTICSLSSYIDSLNKNTTVVTIEKTEEREFYPLSSAQKRIYFTVSKEGDDSISYNTAGGIILDKTPNIEKLENCLKKLIYRHDSLRTYFEVIDQNIVQKIKENIDFKLVVENGNFSEINSIIKNFIKPFKLDKAPLFRFKLVKLNNGKCLVLLDMHHIISDGTSLSILLKELCDLYNDNTLDEKTIDYKDFAVWEDSRSNFKEYIQDEDYWTTQFENEIPLLNLPTTHPRPNIRSFEGSSFHVKFDNLLTNKINDTSKSLGITPYMLLLSVYYILLYKYTGQEDIIVGTPIVGRDIPELSNIVGMFVNTLALRSKIDSSVTFNEYLDSIKKLCVNSFAHQTYPFDELINKLNIKRDSNRNPLFDTMFIYQNDGYSTINLNGIKGENYIPDYNISKFDLSLEIIPKDDILNLRFEYCTKLFDRDYIERFSKHYLNILENILENNEQKISNIDMLSKEEKDKILYEFNNTDLEYDKNKSLIALFEEQVEKNPNNIAVIFENQKVTYSELNERANRLANCLIRKNIKRNDIIGIMVNRSVETIVCMLGVLKSGAAYMLIDYALPSGRILYMLQNSNSPLLITSTNMKDIDSQNKLYIDTEDLTKYSKNNLDIYSSNEDSLCVIYTSGSTGNPKGVLLKRIGPIGVVLNHKKNMNTNICDNFLSISSISFDMFMVETFVPLISGKTMILTNEEEQKIPIAMSDLIINKNIDFILTTPSRIELFLSDTRTIRCLKNIKNIQLGGEVFTPELFSKLRKYTDAEIYNAYGPTEITACCSCKKLTDPSSINIGKPFLNTNIFICDANLNLCPIGIQGEICITGDGIAQGYINNKELTNQSFIPNPFGNGLIYKTGDIGKYNSYGEIEYIGRRDFQIKIRGLRIELSEIEKQLLSIPDISNSAVVYNKTDINEYIVGFFMANKTLDIANVRNELTKHLPLYMVPKYIIQLDSFPITTNGKISKKELLKYDVSVVDNQNYVKPETELQELFCKVWEQLLSTKVGIDDDVFELGADSLIAIKFKTELLSYNINVPYADIFRYTTVRKLCQLHDTLDNSEDISNFDYSNIHLTLSKNSIDNMNKNMFINKTHNNILLFGVNGFVGIHVLHSFIKNDTGKAYCVIRDKNNKSAYNRFIDTAHFYFGEELDEYIDTRIILINANITKENFGLSDSKYKEVTDNVSIIINAAATVKHYGQFKDFKSINIDLTQNLIDYCMKFKKRLIHLSTASVSGGVFADERYMPESSSFSESNLYIGQKLDNLYTKSKFEAERLILSNISNGLNAQILRLGNMCNRYVDGKFQINPEENAFVSRLRTFIKIGCMPERLSNWNIEFTPVDICADAITIIMQNYVENFTVFHLYDNNYILMNKLVNKINNLDLKLEFIDATSFDMKVNEILSDKNKKDVLSGIIYDIDINKDLDYSKDITVSSEFSNSFLKVLGFSWPIIDDNYLGKYIKYFKQIKFI